LPAYRVICSAQNGFSVFQIDGVWGFSILALPLVFAALCIALYWDDMQKVKEMVFRDAFASKNRSHARIRFRYVGWNKMLVTANRDP